MVEQGVNMHQVKTFLHRYFTHDASRNVLMSWVATLLLIGALTGCNAKIRNHGYVPRASEIALLEPGVSNKAFVVSTLGTPIFINDFSDNRWHYVAFKTSQIGASTPEITRYQVLQLLFDEQNILSEIKQHDKSDLVDVNFEQDFTPASGRTMGAMEQIISNIGRFN